MMSFRVLPVEFTSKFSVKDSLHPHPFPKCWIKMFAFYFIFAAQTEESNLISVTTTYGALSEREKEKQIYIFSTYQQKMNKATRAIPRV